MGWGRKAKRLDGTPAIDDVPSDWLDFTKASTNGPLAQGAALTGGYAGICSFRSEWRCDVETLRRSERPVIGKLRGRAVWPVFGRDCVKSHFARRVGSRT